MKRYGICLLLCLLLAVVCFGAGYAMSSVQERSGSAISNTAFSTEQMTDEMPYERAEGNTGAGADRIMAGQDEDSADRGDEEYGVDGETEQAVVNQRYVEPAAERPLERYYLVSETGFLLVFAEDMSTICLYTHIPITDFPEKEQDRLREGIWFPSMLEVFHYLESYTS